MAAEVMLLALVLAVLPAWRGEAATVPPGGTWFSATAQWPPLPYHPFPELTTVEIEPGVYVYDDEEVDYAMMRSLQAAAPSPPMPEGGGGGGEDVLFESMSWTNRGCAIWLQLSPPTNGYALLTLHNTIPGTNYQILSKTNLASTTWAFETNMVGSSGQDYTLTNIATLDRPYLFLIATEIRHYETNATFSGLSYDDTLSDPPDTMAAAGPSHLVELLNGLVSESQSVAVFAKTNGAKLEEISTDLFFAKAEFFGTNYNGSVFNDQRILYNEQAGRWVAVTIHARGSCDVILAVSTNDSPCGLTNWTKYRLPMSSSGFDSDYATLGLDANGIYLTVLKRSNSGTNAFQRVMAIKKPEIYQGVYLTNSALFLSNRFDLDTNASDIKPRTIQPAVNFDALATNAPAWLVAKGPPQLTSNYLGGAVLYRRIVWDGLFARLVDTNWVAVDAGSVEPYRDYFDTDGPGGDSSTQFGIIVPQAGGTNRITLATVASRLMNAVVRNGCLYTCQHVGLSGTNGVYSGDASGTNVDRSAVQWLKLQIRSSGLALTYFRHGRIYDSAPSTPWYYYFPSVAVNCASDMVFGFSGSATNHYIGAFFAWRPAASAVEDPPFLFQPGTVHWPSYRWGDYSATFIDPLDAGLIWAVQQYATTGSEGDVWGTSITKIRRKH